MNANESERTRSNPIETPPQPPQPPQPPKNPIRYDKKSRGLQSEGTPNFNGTTRRR
jgi:hypothetical protein